MLEPQLAALFLYRKYKCKDFLSSLLCKKSRLTGISTIAKAEEKTMFEYNGYHFEPERKLKKEEKKDICAFSKQISSDRELGMCDYDI